MEPQYQFHITNINCWPMNTGHWIVTGKQYHGHTIVINIYWLITTSHTYTAEYITDNNNVTIIST